MTSIQYRIFKPSDKFVLTANMVIYTISAVCLLIVLISKSILGTSFIEDIATITFIVDLFAGILLLISSQFTRKTLKGSFEGFISIDDDFVTIDDRNILIDNVHMIDFKIDDFCGRFIPCYSADFNPKRSNGISNFCEIELIDGEIIQLQFQQLQKDDFIKNRDILISYHKKGALSFIRLIQLLKIEGYDNIQYFKRTIEN